MDVPALLTVLTDYGFADTSTQRKVDILNDVMWDICAREPWPFLEKSLNLTFNGAVSAPLNWTSVIQPEVVSVLSIVDTQYPLRLYPIRIEEFQNSLGARATLVDDPQYYYFLGPVLNVWPIPRASNVTTNCTYTYWPAALTSSSAEVAIPLPKRFHSALYFGALAQLYEMEDDAENGTRFDTRFENKLQQMRNDLWLRQRDRADTIEITDSDDDHFIL